MEYKKQAEAFCKRNGVTMSVGEGVWRRPIWDEQREHCVFPVRLRRGGRSMTVQFGQSIAEGGNRPSKYDVLACITKSDPGSFEEFCGEYGYDTDSRKAERTWKAVVREWKAVSRVFGGCLDELAEIY